MKRTPEQKREYVAALAAAAELITPDEVKVFLATTAQAFSFKNCQMILSQCPHASAVAGFHAWKHAGRSVRKGEKGLAIFAPRMKKDADNDGTTLAGFGIVYVFDISQTEPLEKEISETLDKAAALV